MWYIYLCQFEKRLLHWMWHWGVNVLIFKISLHQRKIQPRYLECYLLLNGRFYPAICFRVYLLLLRSHGISFHGTWFTNTGEKHRRLFLFTKHKWVIKSLGPVRGISYIWEGFASITSSENSIPELWYWTFVYLKM